MQIEILVYAYYWWHHTINPWTFTAQKDDRSGWHLKLWCNAPVILKSVSAKMCNGKLTKVAIVARQDHPDIEAEVLAELLSPSELLIEPFPRWSPEPGDTVVILAGQYERWWLDEAGRQTYQIIGKTKVYSKSDDAWRRKYDYRNLDVICAKFTLKNVSGDFAFILHGKYQEVFKVPVNCLAVLEKGASWKAA